MPRWISRSGRALRLVPVAASEPQPGARRGHVRDVGVHLVPLGVGERPARRSAAPARASPRTSGRRRGCRARASRPRARRRRRPARAPRAGRRSRAGSSCTLVQAMFTSACARVLSSPSRVARSSARSPHLSASSRVLGEHRELRDAAAGARELDRLAERLEDRDRLERLRARGLAVARRTSAAATARACSGRRAAWSPRSRWMPIAPSIAPKASSRRPTR